MDLERFRYCSQPPQTNCPRLSKHKPKVQNKETKVKPRQGAAGRDWSLPWVYIDFPDPYLGFAILFTLGAKSRLQGYENTKRRYRTRKPGQNQGREQRAGIDLYLGFTLISLLPTLVLQVFSLWELKRGCKVMKIQNEGTEHGNQSKTKVGNSGQELIPTLDFPWFPWSLPWICYFRRFQGPRWDRWGMRSCKLPKWKTKVGNKTQKRTTEQEYPPKARYRALFQGANAKR